MNRWNSPGGYKAVFKISLPLVMSMISHTMMQFTDRIFLGHYSIDAIAASMPAAIAAFLFIAFFMGIGEYVSVFVAQYTGAVRPERVGSALWQGIWFSIPAGILLASLALVAKPIFALGGHPAHIQALEVPYFQVLTLGGGLVILVTVLSCFYSGRGLTMPVMIVNILGAALNIPLDYALINGWWIFPELGIVGAGIATVCGSLFMLILFVALIFRKENNARFAVIKNWRFELALFKRFLSFGLPGGVSFFIDMFAVTFFIFMIGRVGAVELAATNMVISLDLLAFLPVVGIGIATSVLVGQNVGAGTPELGERATHSAVHLAVGYMSVMATCFLLFPEQLLNLFRDKNMSEAEFAIVANMGVQMLRYVAVYCVLNGIVLTYFGGLKGAGDVRFVMWTSVVCSFGCIVLPVMALVAWTDMGFHGPWICLSLYALTLSIIAVLRFKGGKWKNMQVIEGA